MSEGMRDQFVENDTLYNMNSGTSPLTGSARGPYHRKRRKSKSAKATYHRRRKNSSSSRRPKFGSPAWFAKYKPHKHRRKHRKRKR